MIYTKLLPIYRLVFLFCITPFMLAKLPFGSKACGLNSCRSFCSQPSVNIRVVILVFVVYIPSGHWFIRVLSKGCYKDARLGLQAVALIMVT